MSNSIHWNNVFQRKDTTKVSWYQEVPTTSLELIEKYMIDKESFILDIGGGDSKLPDYLQTKGYRNIAVLDISKMALMASQYRLAEKAKTIDWIIEDVLKWQPTNQFDLWHDRAVFHFMVSKEEQISYKETLLAGLKKEGIAIIATFSKNNGPTKCSGLDVCQHNELSISTLFAPEFKLVESFEYGHNTSSGQTQIFSWNIIKKLV